MVLSVTYVLNTTKEDWIIWADFVNRNYKIKFYDSNNEVIGNKVDLSKIFELWNVNGDNGFSAAVFLGDIILQTYFFSDEEIENDITPIEINSMNDHIKLVDYMTKLSKVLNKKAILSPESDSETELIAVYNDEVIINL